MATEKQIQANRINAQKAGVKTEAGKAVSRLNALSHGLLSGEVLLPGEDGTRLEGICQRLMEEYQPVGEMETILVERLVSSVWRLKRAVQAEKRYNQNRRFLDKTTLELLTNVDYSFDSWQNVIRYETALEHQVIKSLRELERLQKLRKASDPLSKILEIQPGSASNPESAGPDLA